MGSFPRSDPNLMASLSRGVVKQEVTNSLFDMESLKALDIDGLHAQFYQTEWDIVGDSLFSMIRKGFENGKVEEYLNKTLIILIPKVNGPEVITQLCPISLCTVPYKLFTKVIVN